MKKLLISAVALVLIGSNANAQSLQETEDWILKKSELSIYSYQMKYSFTDGKFESRYEPMSVIGARIIVNRSIPIAEIKTISHVVGDNYISFKLKCDYDCVYHENNDGDGKFESEMMDEHFLFEIYGEKGGKPDLALIPRLEKAFLKLVELNGGKAKIVPHVEKKEAF